MASAWVICAFPIQAAAQKAGLLYDCDITRKSTGDWISDKIGIVIDQQGDTFVSDAITLHFLNAPVNADISRNTDRVLVVNWRIDSAKSGSNQAVTTFSYSAKVNKAKNKVSVYAKPEGYSNKVNGTETCALRTE